MKISGARKIALIGVAASSISIAVAQESAQTAEMGQVQQDLENAKAAVEEAKDIAEQIILDAQKEANLILQNAAVNEKRKGQWLGFALAKALTMLVA